MDRGADRVTLSIRFTCRGSVRTGIVVRFINAADAFWFIWRGAADRVSRDSARTFSE